MPKHPADCGCSRRTFLKGSGLTLAGFGLTSLFPGAIMRHAMAAGGNDNRFMFIFLRGGNDGLNTVIPHGDPDYNVTNRGAIYIDPVDAIDLNGFASLHPGLADLMDSYNAGDLAVIHQAGYPYASASHFDGQRIWENGNPADSQSLEGWLYRTIVENSFTDGAVVPAISAQSNQPVLLRGSRPFINVADPDNFDLSLPFLGEPLRTKVVQSWPPHFAGLQGLAPYGPILARTGLEIASFVSEFDAWDQAGWDPKDPDNPTWSLFPVSFATNPDDPSGPNGKKFRAGSYQFFQDLKICALASLESDPASNANGTSVTGTQLAGWDLHTGQGGVGGRHHELLSWLAYGMRSLRIVLSGAALDPRNYTSVWDKTVISTMSEYGRTSSYNGNGGTDHGKASCLLAQGGAVNGGVYLCDGSSWPTGTMYSVGSGPGTGVKRYVAPGVDFRSIFWEIMRDHLGASPASVEATFPGYTAQGLASQELGFINSMP